MDFQIQITSDLSLKLRSKEDAPEFFRLIQKNKQEFQKWFPWVDGTTSVGDTEIFISRCREAFHQKRSADFGILYQEHWIGSMGFHTIQANHEWAEIGYWLDADFVGRGLMTQCVEAMIDYGFKEFNLHRIQICCNSLNIRSKAIPERLGFTLEGVVRECRKQSSGYSNGLIYGLLRNEWAGR